MGQTKELLQKIKEAVRDGRLSEGNIPVADLKACVYSELQANCNTFSEAQYHEVMQSFYELCSNISDEEQDKNKILFLIDALILCNDMISQTIHMLENGEYWRYMHRKELDDPEIMEIIEYIDRERKARLLNYDFTKKYEDLPVAVFLDEGCQMNYLWHRGRKMFFPQGWEEERIVGYYRSITMEQDSDSPHCYYSAGWGVEIGDIVVDAGAAEGIFALNIIDRAGKIYLVESDPGWIKALEQTFRDDREKVKIIYGFLDSIDEGNRVSIDRLFEQEEINYIKMDIEGYEKAALLGAEKTMERCGNIRCAICAYHCREDEEWIRTMLEHQGFVTEVSRGYIYPDWTLEAYLKAELRRGIVFGKKRDRC